MWEAFSVSATTGETTVNRTEDATLITQCKLRIHVDMHAHLTKLAGAAGRSLNAEIRHAALPWLRRQGLITVSQNGEVLPHSSPKSAS